MVDFHYNFASAEIQERNYHITNNHLSIENRSMETKNEHLLYLGYLSTHESLVHQFDPWKSRAII